MAAFHPLAHRPSTFLINDDLNSKKVTFDRATFSLGADQALPRWRAQAAKSSFALNLWDRSVRDGNVILIPLKTAVQALNVRGVAAQLGERKVRRALIPHPTNGEASLPSPLLMVLNRGTTTKMPQNEGAVSTTSEVNAQSLIAAMLVAAGSPVDLNVWNAAARCPDPWLIDMLHAFVPLSPNDPRLAGATDHPLHQAARTGWATTPSTMAKLVNLGWDVNAQYPSGYTPLLYAAISGQGGNVQWLLDHGAQPSQDLLTFSVVRRWSHLIEPFLQQGLDLNDPRQRPSFLDIAVDNHDAAMVHRLLHHGAALSDATLERLILKAQTLETTGHDGRFQTSDETKVGLRSIVQRFEHEGLHRFSRKNLAGDEALPVMAERKRL